MESEKNSLNQLNQISSQENLNVRPMEIKILKQIKYFPSLFMLRTPFGEVEKISFDDYNFLDCVKYVSRSRLTFNGCYELINGELREVRGLYQISAPDLVSYQSRQKMTRDINEIPELIKKVLQINNVSTGKLLIKFDNYQISVYDKFKKAPLIELQPIKVQGHLLIYEITKPRDMKGLLYGKGNDLQIYNHNFKFDREVKILNTVSSPGVTKLIYVFEPTEVEITSQDHDTITLFLSKDSYYLVVHTKPRINKSD